MGVLHFADGGLGYAYPKPNREYQPVASPFNGLVVITNARYSTAAHWRIIRAAGPEPRGDVTRPDRAWDSHSFWAIPVGPSNPGHDRMTTVSVTCGELTRALSAAINN